MKLQVSPNNWSCMAVAAAMVLNKPLSEVIQGLGHDGSEKVWQPHWEDQVAGFHIHEIIDYAWMQNATPVTPFLRYPLVTPSPAHPEQLAKFAREPDLERRFTNRLYGRVGIITGTVIFGRGHAVAWNGHKIYDPRGYVYTYAEAETDYHYHADIFWMFGGMDVSPFTVVS